jgi:8-oxo-dGTP diphosphatase
MEPKMFVATKAFIVFKRKVLILRESSAYKDGTNVGRYDVVGGRVEPGQRFDESLIREIKEETGLAVKVGRPFFVNEWRPVVKDEPWQIVGTFFECSTESDKVILGEDHDGFEWINPKDFIKYNLIENLIPAFESYNELHNQVPGNN